MLFQKSAAVNVIKQTDKYKITKPFRISVKFNKRNLYSPGHTILVNTMVWSFGQDRF